MKKILVSLCLISTLAFSGCADPVDTEDRFSEDSGEQGLIPRESNYLKKVVVDGTTCIIFSDAAISCDWDTPASQSPSPEPEYYQ